MRTICARKCYFENWQPPHLHMALLRSTPDGRQRKWPRMRARTHVVGRQPQRLRQPRPSANRTLRRAPRGMQGESGSNAEGAAAQVWVPAAAQLLDQGAAQDLKAKAAHVFNEKWHRTCDDAWHRFSDARWHRFCDQRWHRNWGRFCMRPGTTFA